MKIISLVENTTKSGLQTRHGLSLYIKTRTHTILFDLGPDNTLFENAKKRDIDLSKVDIVVISHGHIDHGGALQRFLKINSSARIYVQKSAFVPHYSKFLLFKVPIGIDECLKDNRQIILLEGNHKIDDELFLFTISNTTVLTSPLNNVLYDKYEKDIFKHEQNLIISEKKTVLIMGCGHNGIINITNEANKYNPSLCIGGFHLMNPITRRMVSTNYLNKLVTMLQEFNNIKFYTCHCTGLKAFYYLSRRINNIHYLSCGDEMIIE